MAICTPTLYSSTLSQFWLPNGGVCSSLRDIAATNKRECVSELSSVEQHVSHQWASSFCVFKLSHMLHERCVLWRNTKPFPCLFVLDIRLDLGTAHSKRCNPTISLFHRLLSSNFLSICRNLAASSVFSASCLSRLSFSCSVLTLPSFRGWRWRFWCRPTTLRARCLQ